MNYYDLDEHELKLAQTLKEIYVAFCGRDFTRWPERQLEFRKIASKVDHEGMWHPPDWRCLRCDVYNLAAEVKCRKCGMGRKQVGDWVTPCEHCKRPIIATVASARDSA